MPNQVKRAVETVLDLVYPRAIACGICGVELDLPGVLCPDCAKLMPPPFGPICPGCGRTCTGEERMCRSCRANGAVSDGGFAAHDYKDLARGLLVAMKFKDRTSSRELFCYGMAEAVKAGGVAGIVDCVVPVPMHWMRRLNRGYNQSELLAEWVAQALAKPLLRRALSRPVHTRIVSRTKGGLRQRRKSAESSYRAGRDAVAGKVVLLVDDILTTGSTLRVCVAILRQMGAVRVYTVVAAAVPE